MNAWIDVFLIPRLTQLAVWSLQWAILIVVLAAWFAVRQPRTAVIRSAAARFILFAGLTLPLLPQFWGPVIPLPKSASQAAPEMSGQRTGAVPKSPRIQTRPRFDAGDGEPEIPEFAALPKMAAQVEVQAIEVGLAAQPRTPAQQEPLGWTRSLALIVATIWAAGVVLHGARLILGWFWLNRVCRSATLASPAYATELAECCRRMGVTRRVLLAEHKLVESPVLMGGRHPHILIPFAWGQIAAESRRAILLHELAHVLRRDDVAKLLEEMVLALFFFHPLVHWLLSNIAATREELCDDAVIGQGIAPRELAGVLLEACRVFGTGRAVLLPRAVTLPFFRQRSVKDRIHALMEESNMPRWKLTPSRHAFIALGTLLGGFAVFIAGFGIRAESPPKDAVQPATQNAASSDPAPSPPPVKTLVLDLSGLISAEEYEKLMNGDKTIELEGIGSINMETLMSLSYIAQPEVPRGRLVDIAGNPIVPAEGLRITACIMPMSREICGWASHNFLLADAEGRFAIISNTDAENPDRTVQLLVRLASGHSFETVVQPVAGQLIDVHLPTHLRPKVAPPHEVAADELAGVVVDEQGEPLSDVGVEINEGMCDDEPGFRAVSDNQGNFRLMKLGRLFDEGDARNVMVRFRKPGFSPERFLHQPVGVKGWVVALSGRTYFEGIVRGPDGKPAPGAQLRANQGPKQLEGTIISHLWTETFADAAGRYRLYLQPDEYELFVKSSGAGVARLAKQPILFGEQRTLDVALVPGVAFRANVVDSETQQPVPNVRLLHWSHPGIEGRSDAQGLLAIDDMLPGDFEFVVEADGYRRWWSEEAKSEWSRLEKEDPRRKFQRNFDHLDFDLEPGMAAVTIAVERSVQITGRVVDPDGQPVAGATVAPALTGTGNSLTGDTRFSEQTKLDGTFVIELPASHGAKYNLVAHDGDYDEWRQWANGVLPPIQTKPGDELTGVETRLTRPAVVRGKVVDEQGQPLAGFKISADPVDKLENRYYVPMAVTSADGTFELPFIRPGEHVIRANHPAPEATAGVGILPVKYSNTTEPEKRLTLTPGQIVDDLVLVSEARK